MKINIICTIIWLLIFQTLVYADEPLDNIEKLDAILVLDASASMQVSDPLNLRADGAKLFIQLLRPDDRLGLVAFGDGARVLRPLSHFDSEQIQSVNQAIDNIKNIEEYTNLYDSLEASFQMLRENGRGDAEKIIILFSDGQMEPNPVNGTAKQYTSMLLQDTLRKAKSYHIKIYTLSFSPEADKVFLAQISAETSGMHWYAPTADAIQQSFANLFLAAKKPQMLPFNNQGFLIDEGVDEATVYINRDENHNISLMSPVGLDVDDKTEDNNIKWYKGNKFDVVTLLTPQAGEWAVNGMPKDGGFIAVMTNLKMTLEFPTSITSGIPQLAKASLFDALKPVNIRDITQGVRYKLKVTPIDRISTPIIEEELIDDGTLGDEITGDGIFSREINVEDEGEYKMSVTAIGSTFERYQQVVFSVRPRLVSVEVIDKSESFLAKHRSEDDGIGSNTYFKVNLSSETSNLKNIKIKLWAVDKNRTKINFLLKKRERYELPTDILPIAGEYKIYAELIAKDRRSKQPVYEESKKLTYVKENSEVSADDLVISFDRSFKQKESNLNLLPFTFSLLVMTILNGGLAGGAYALIKKKLTESEDGESTTFEIAALDDVIAGVMSFEARAREQEINFNDPVFTEDKYLEANQSSNKTEASSDNIDVKRKNSSEEAAQ